MSQSLVNNLIHLVYSTKDRSPSIPAEIQQELYGYQAGIFKTLRSPAIAIGGVEDHLHSLFRLSKNVALSKVVEEVKKSSSKWMKGPKRIENFCWQAGYAAFSVSQSNLEAVKKYIERQRVHHRKSTFHDELLQLLARHQIEYDERFLWD